MGIALICRQSEKEAFGTVVMFSIKIDDVKQPVLLFSAFVIFFFKYFNSSSSFAFHSFTNTRCYLISHFLYNLLRIQVAV